MSSTAHLALAACLAKLPPSQSTWEKVSRLVELCPEPQPLDSFVRSSLSEALDHCHFRGASCAHLHDPTLDSHGDRLAVPLSSSAAAAAPNGHERSRVEDSKSALSVAGAHVSPRIDASSQQAILSLCNYLVDSDGAYFTLLLPRLLHLFLSLPLYRWETHSHHKSAAMSISSPQWFAMEFLTRLGRITDALPEAKAPVETALVLCVRSCQSLLEERHKGRRRIDPAHTPPMLIFLGLLEAFGGTAIEPGRHAAKSMGMIFSQLLDKIHSESKRMKHKSSAATQNGRNAKSSKKRPNGVVAVNVTDDATHTQTHLLGVVHGTLSMSSSAVTVSEMSSADTVEGADALNVNGGNEHLKSAAPKASPHSNSRSRHRDRDAKGGGGDSRRKPWIRFEIVEALVIRALAMLLERQIISPCSGMGADVFWPAVVKNSANKHGGSNGDALLSTSMSKSPLRSSDPKLQDLHRNMSTGAHNGVRRRFSVPMPEMEIDDDAPVKVFALSQVSNLFNYTLRKLKSFHSTSSIAVYLNSIKLAHVSSAVHHEIKSRRPASAAQSALHVDSKDDVQKLLSLFLDILLSNVWSLRDPEAVRKHERGGSSISSAFNTHFSSSHSNRSLVGSSPVARSVASRVQVCHAVLGGITTLFGLFAFEATSMGTVLRILTTLLISDDGVTHPTEDQEVRDALTDALACVVRSELTREQWDVATTRKFLFALENMRTTAAPDEPETPESQSLVLLMGRLMVLVNRKEVTDHILPLLVDRFEHYPKLLHLVVPQLTGIALTSGSRLVFTNVVTLFINTYRNPFDSQNKHNTKEIPDAFYRLANELQDFERRRILARRLIELFVELAGDIQRRSHSSDLTGSGQYPSASAAASAHEGTKQSKPESMTGVLGFLLPSIARLVSRGSLNPQVAEARKVPKMLVDVVSPSSPEFLPVEKFALHGHMKSVGARVYDRRQFDVKWFKDMWFYLVLYKFVNPDPAGRRWPEDWLEAVDILAQSTPILTPTSLAVEFDAIDSNAPIPSETALALARQLTQILPKQAALISSFSPSRIIHVLIIYHLETIRASKGTVYAIFEYMNNEALREAGLMQCVRGVANTIFVVYMNTIAAMPSTPERTRNLESHVNFLLVRCCSRYMEIARKAKNLLTQLTGRFPNLQWSRTCLTTLLDILQVVMSTVDSEEALSTSYDLREIPQTISTSSQVSSTLIGDLDLPEELGRRKQILDLLRNISKKWLEDARYSAPEETTSVVSQYLQNLQALSSHAANLQSHAGAALALKVGSGFSSRASSHPTNQSYGSVTAALGLKERYVGEIWGLYHSYARQQLDNARNLERRNSAPPNGSELYSQDDLMGEPAATSRSKRESSFMPFGQYLSNRLEESFQELLVRHRKLLEDDQKRKRASHAPSSHSDSQSSRLTPLAHQKFNRDFEFVLLRTAAALVWSAQCINSGELPSEDSEVDSKSLLHLLCMAPASVFTPSALQAATFAWRWLLAASKSFYVALLVEMKAGWSYTIRKRMGLFAATPPGSISHTAHSSKPPPPPPSSTSSLASSGEASQHDLFSNVTPHIIWIKFLTELVHSLSLMTNDAASLLLSMMHKALENPRHLTQTPISFGARMRLLSLAHSLVVSSHAQFEGLELLRERLYSCAFDWFAYPASWYNPPSFKTIQEDAVVVVELCKVLQAKVVAKGDLSYVAASADSIRFDGGKSTISRATTAQKSAAISMYHSSRGSFESGIGGGSRAGTSLVDGPNAMMGSGASGAGGSTDDVAVATRNRQRHLLLVLLCHELDRISCWHNPLKRKEMFQDEALFTVAGLNIHAGQWIGFAETAWAIDPRLAIQLCKRFPYVDVLRSELCSRILSSPQRVYHVPEAVPYFVTEQNVAANVPQLNHLVYFVPASISVAITLLLEPFSKNRIINEYAMRILRDNDSDDVLFFLPQLVQALRYDEFDLLRRYLLKAALASPKFSHLLIWACQIEAYLDDEYDPAKGPPPDEKLCVLARTLEQEILDSMNADQREWFDLEFGYFERINNISASLDANDDKPKKRRLLREKLRDYKKVLDGELDVRSKARLTAGKSNDEDDPDRPHIYMPTNPQFEIVDVIPESGNPMQSAAKVPILVAFKTRDLSAPPELVIEPDSSSAGPQETASRAADGTDDEPSKAKDRRRGAGGGTSARPNTSGRTVKSSVKPHTKGRERKRSATGIKDSIRAKFHSLKSSSKQFGKSAKRKKSGADKDDEDKRHQDAETEDGEVESSDSEEEEEEEKKEAVKKEPKRMRPISVQAAIFKTDDDIRQDALSLQIIELFGNIFRVSGLPLRVFPYRVVPTRTGSNRIVGGIIECVKNAKSRDELGKENDLSLRQYFVEKYGREDGIAYKRAQRNFVTSFAGYAICSYILQVKDRHNGNIMFTDEGNMVHIDFGFLLGISPGGDLGFENAGFKFTQEMAEIMGGGPESPVYQWFLELCVRGFLAVRAHWDEVVPLVSMMQHSSLPFFKRDLKNTVVKFLADRFFPRRDEKFAADQMIAIVREAHNNLRTRVYDQVQSAQQGIWYLP